MEQKAVHVKGDSVKLNIRNRRRWSLMTYDAILLILVNAVILGVYPSSAINLDLRTYIFQNIVSIVSIFLCRHVACVYKQIWRYGGAAAYIRLILADAAAGVLYVCMQNILPIHNVMFIHVFAVVALNLLLTVSIRLVYQFLYERASRQEQMSGIFWKAVDLLTGLTFTAEKTDREPIRKGTKINIAIVGAGRVGVMLAEELLRNTRSAYQPCCFIDCDRTKIGREISGIPVLSIEDAIAEKLAQYPVQEIVFALPQMEAERKRELYEYYKQTGCKIMVYDYPVMQTAGNSKRYMREFDIEELLFRQPIEFHNEKTSAYYKDKVVLITGGGGSIGSELCRQIAKMQPKCLVVLDVYENGAYDIQQELRIAYANKLNLHVEIVSVCDKRGFERVFETYHPDILLHAAAHKHVPLMEHNCCEAVKNNVFGTLHAVELAEKYGVGRFILISTDKAVNPTNIMGATKRICEMIVLSHSRSGSGTVYSATRFGNVLGSAGSVVPLFKKQIMNGGPVTITDKRIIRYFMTIPEATQLVLQSGAMAKNGELFVLDMGKPVKILELAENMIWLSGYEPYEDIQIVETGLRPGEKLYEELLIRTEELSKTENSMIFIERDVPLTLQELDEKLAILQIAVASENDDAVRDALKSTVPSYSEPNSVNSGVQGAMSLT